MSQGRLRNSHDAFSLFISNSCETVFSSSGIATRNASSMSRKRTGYCSRVPRPLIYPSISAQQPSSEILKAVGIHAKAEEKMASSSMLGCLLHILVSNLPSIVGGGLTESGRGVTSAMYGSAESFRVGKVKLRWCAHTERGGSSPGLCLLSPGGNPWAPWRRVHQIHE
jgi:hypothetical protein